MSKTILLDYEKVWQLVGAVQLRHAACLLFNHDPHTISYHGELPRDAKTMLIALRKAILLGQLQAFGAWEWPPGSDVEIPIANENIRPSTDLADCTAVRSIDLARWCETNGVSQRIWPVTESNIAPLSRERWSVPLRAAVEVSEYVRNNPDTCKGRSPKAAILMRLTEAFPGLKPSMRKRIAIVANWEQRGGAPKTPST